MSVKHSETVMSMARMLVSKEAKLLLTAAVSSMRRALDTGTVTPIFPLELPFVFAGDEQTSAWSGTQSCSSRSLLPFFFHYSWDRHKLLIRTSLEFSRTAQVLDTKG